MIQVVIKSRMGSVPKVCMVILSPYGWNKKLENIPANGQFLASSSLMEKIQQQFKKSVREQIIAEHISHDLYSSCGDLKVA